LSTLLSAAAVLALCSVEASAQFTGVVVPPKPKVDLVVDTPKAVAQMRDSVARLNLTSMKDWVDSAAMALGVPTAPAATDTGRMPAPVPPPAIPARIEDPAIPARSTTEFREGATAPNTATPIPFLALLGLSSLAAGLWLLRGRRA
jgi:hypothetical protein